MASVVPSRAVERHTQTVLAACVVMILVWVAATTQNTSVAVARMEVEIIHMKDAINDLKMEK